ncbi:MAG TPA: signal recognition particle-docking protein FtsY [Candidatus Nitrosopolaris sp.]|nr:signal recognition particle-docking protein FtsY [Candidatus Nitrosopolaris sp.]
MFDQLRKAFSSATKSIGQRELSEKDLDNILFDLQLGLLESDVAQEVIDDLSTKLKKELLGLKLEKDQNKEELIRLRFQAVITEMFAKTGKVGLIDKIKAKRELKGGPFVVVFLGINGTGKTTTVAKIASLLRKNGISVVLAAADTHRAGAIEQLTQHAERLAIKVIAQRYGADPSAVGRDAVDYSKKHHMDAVLIDTAGRMQTAKNLMDEIGKIVKVVKPDIKLFVGDSLAGNDTINQAREFFEYTEFDGAVLTKTDADAKGGSAISIVYTTSKPIVYLGVGQEYDDLIPFEMDKYLQSLFGSSQSITTDNPVLGPKLTSEPNVTEKSEAEFLSSGPLEKADEISKPMIGTTGAKESSGAADYSPTPEKEKSPLPESAIHVAEPENDTKTVLDIESTFLKDNGQESETKESREDIILTHIDEEPGKKKSRFSRLFNRKKNDKESKIVEEPDTKITAEENDDLTDVESKEQRTEKKDSRRRPDEKEKQGKDADEKVVYLSDEDIEDLLK